MQRSSQVLFQKPVQQKKQYLLLGTLRVKTKKGHVPGNPFLTVSLREIWLWERDGALQEKPGTKSFIKTWFKCDFPLLMSLQQSSGLGEMGLIKDIKDIKDKSSHLLPSSLLPGKSAFFLPFLFLSAETASGTSTALLHVFQEKRDHKLPSFTF